MEFLVTSTLSLPSELVGDARESLLRREAARGRELHAAGTIVRIWRVPGKAASIAVWNATDATELHELLMSLPVASWLQIDVQPLARHYLEG